MSVLIRKGSDKVIYVRLVQEANQEPYDLSDADDITVRFAKADDSVLEKKLSDESVALVGNAVLGKFSVTLTDTETALLKADDAAGIEVLLAFGSDEIGIQLSNTIKVRPALFP